MDENLRQFKDVLKGAKQDLSAAKADLNVFKENLNCLTVTDVYQLADKAYRGLPPLLLNDHHVEVQGRLGRGYMMDTEGRVVEVNILGDGLRDNQPIKIIGEAKSQLSIPNIDRFVRRQLTPLQVLFSQVFPVLVTYMVSSPEVETYAQEQGIALYYSYDWQD